jgi:hypothetical protein
MSSVGKHEAVFFFGNNGISKEMLYSEFESVLDALVPMPEVANSNIHAAYSVIDGGLNLIGIVFFTLKFSGEGFADPSWNLPLEKLIEKGVDGPDMGAGKVKIYMAGSDSGEYQQYLWDPDERGGKNDLIHLRDIVRGNRLCLTQDNNESEWMGDASMIMNQDEAVSGGVPTAVPTAAPVAVPIASEPAAGLNEANVPVASTLMADSSDEFSQAMKIIESQRIRITALENAIQKLQSGPDLTEPYEEAKAEISALQKRIADMEGESAGLQADMGDALTQRKTLEKNIADLEKKNEKAVKQVEEKLEKSEKQAKEKLESLKAKYEKSAKSSIDKLEKELSKKFSDKEKSLENDFKSKIDNEKEEQAKLEQQLENFKKELTELRGDKFRLMKDGNAESFFKKLNDADLSFMTFKPGAGHMTIPLDEIGLYMDSPNEYVAKKCNIPLKSYENWLDHYNSPVCSAPLPGDKICGDKVQRIDMPAKFQLGYSDRCTKHGGK